MKLCVTLLLFAFLCLAEAQRCPGGFVRAMNGACQRCPPGTFRRSSDPNSCRKCRPGTFNPYFGAQSPGLCRFCRIGTATSVFGARSCTPCPRGTFASRGSSECLSCPLGTFHRSRLCLPCPKGTYRNSTDSRFCSNCPSRLTSSEGSPSIIYCLPCPAGEQHVFGSKTQAAGCVRCIAVRTFKTSKLDGPCGICPAGHEPNQSRTRCMVCPANHFISNSANKCTPCPDRTASEIGSSICSRPGGKCPKRHVKNSVGGCIRCPIDTFYNKNQRRCEKCPDGSTSRGGTQRFCRFCIGGSSPQGAGKCACPDGMFLVRGTRCERCPAGFGLRNATAEGRSRCQACVPGTFAARKGSTGCDVCPFGKISPGSGAASCSPCPAGQVPALGLRQTRKCIVFATGCSRGEGNDGVWGRNCGPVA